MPSRDEATRKLRSGSRQPLLRVEGLSAEFPGEPARALDGVDLRLRRGQILAVVGEAGAGKTTLGRIIAGLTPASSGKVLFEGKDLAELGASERRSTLQQIQVVTPEALAEPGALAALLKREVKLLVLDEAFDAFDAATRLRVFMDIRRLQDDEGLTCLLLTRSLELAGALSDQILVLHAGQMVETGATSSLVGHPHHPYTMQLPSPKADRAPSLAPESVEVRNPPGCRYRARCPQAFARCAVEAPQLFAVPGGLARCFLHDPDGPGR